MFYASFGFLKGILRMKRFTSILIAGLCGFCSLVYANDLSEVRIKDIIHGGTGCPDGTVRAILSEDRTEASVLFDTYYADTAERGSRLVRVSCNIGLSLEIPSGLSASLITMDYRGFISIPEGGLASLRAEYFFAGQAIGQSLNQSWSTPTPLGGDDFVVNDNIVGLAFSQCGDDVIARANTSILARRGAELADTLIQVDSLDTTAGLLYRFQWRICDEEPSTLL